jgi:hypothetical protein
MQKKPNGHWKVNTQLEERIDMSRKKIDPELKEGIEETTKAIDALVDSEFPAAVATLMFKMKQELITAGFSAEEAFQIVVAHGVQPSGGGRP